MSPERKLELAFEMRDFAWELITLASVSDF